MFQTAKLHIGEKSQILLKIAGVVGAITVIAGGYSFFLNNIWTPTVSIVSVDFENGTATLKLPFGKQIDIHGNSDFLIGADWGVRFGTTVKDGTTKYDRIELVKKGMVVKYITT